jgi:hypothetical protein
MVPRDGHEKPMAAPSPPTFPAQMASSAFENLSQQDAGDTSWHAGNAPDPDDRIYTRGS